MLKSLFLFVLLLLSHVPVSGQIYDFQSISQEDGLPSSSVNVIFQDSRDFIWIGTEGGGLVKYDGIHYEIYNRNNGLFGEFITDIIEDINQNLIIATRYNGIFIYDGVRFIKNINISNKQLSSNLVYKLIKTKGGIVAISDKEMVLISSKYEIKNLFKSNNNYQSVNSLIEITSKKYLIATNNGLFSISDAKIVPFYPDLISGKTTAYKDLKNTIYIGNDKGKLFVFEKNKLSSPSIIRNKKSELFSIKNIFVARSGNIWMSSYDSEGICLKGINTILFFDRSNGFLGENVTTFFQDNSKNLYVGTLGNGFYKTKAQQFIYYNNIDYLNNPYIYSICKNENKFYVSVLKKNVYEFSQKDFGNFKFLKSYPFQNVYASIVNSKKQVVLGNSSGLSIIDGNSVKNVDLTKAFNDKQFDIKYIYQDTRGRYFIGTFGHGLIILDENFQVITTINKSSSASFSNYISSIIGVSSNKWYVATSEGLFLIKEEKNNFFLSKNIIKDNLTVGTEDSYGNFWFSGEKRLYVVTKENKKFLYTEKSGLLSTFINTLIANNDGEIFVGTNLGLSKIKVNSLGEIVDINNYDSKSEFRGLSTNIRAQFKDEKGNIYLATAKGLFKCLAQYKKEDEFIPKIQINAINLFNENNNWINKDTKNKWVNLPEQNHKFKNDQNQLTFEYITINNKLTQNALYSYKLDGVKDDKWSNATNQRVITFSNLSFGNYTFKVRIVNNLGKAISNEATYSFSIEKPFYFNWWFVLIFLVILYFIVNIIFTKSSKYNEEYIKNYSEIETSNEQYRLYFLFLGITIPLLEIVVKLTQIPSRNSLKVNIITGIVLISMYFLSKRFKFIYQNLSTFFLVIFILYGCTTIYRIIQGPENIASSLEFIVMFYLSYNAFKSIRAYWVFVWMVFGLLIILFTNNLIPKQLMVVLLNFSFLTAILNHVRHISFLNSRKKFLFADNIVNKGTSLILAVNLKGEIMFCSETITSILGYSKEEVMGFNYWKLTEDTEFTDVNYQINKGLYVRKLKCKDGTYKHIQWKDSEYSNELYMGIGQDVTEQIQAQNQYKNLVETATDIIYEIDKEGNFIYINDFTEKKIGYKAHEIIGLNFSEFIKQEYRTEVINFYKKIDYTLKDVPVLEFPIVIKSGDDLWLSQKVTVKISEDGKIEGFSAIARDITQIKVLELEKIKRQEKVELYNITINKLVTTRYSDNDSTEKIIQDILKETSINSKVDRVSYWEYDFDKIVCLSMYNKEINEFVLENDACYKNDRPIYFDAIENNKFIAVSDVYSNYDVQEFSQFYFPENNIKSMLDISIFINGQITGILSLEITSEIVSWDTEDVNFARSISDIISLTIENQKSKESEKRFELLANNIPGTVYLSDFDPKWTKIYLNDNVEKLTGYKKEDFLSHKVLLMDLIHQEDRDFVLGEANRAITNFQPFHLTYRLKRKDEKYIWIEEFGDAVLKDGKVNYIEGILIDITQKIEIESEIKAREYAEASNKAKSDFLANMSHEIRTPLNAIVGFSSLLQETNLEENQVEFVTTVNQSAHILLEVVNDILDFSKIETGKLELEYRKTNLHELINQIIDINRFDAEQKEITLELKMHHELPKYVSIDALRMKQIFINLLANAIKFTNRGGVKFKAELISKTVKNAQVRFSVIDSGIGIKHNNQEKIFEPFSQEDSSTTRKYGGSGLGLTISNNILLLMNSKLELDSDYKKGSNFYFDLDLLYYDDEELGIVDVNMLSVDFEDISQTNRNVMFNLTKKILIVEDNKINMLLAKTLINKIMPHAIVAQALNGRLGVEQYIEFKPDLILLDIQMPVLNGYETATEIRTLDKRIPIIALTAGIIKGEKEKCIEAGMNDYISKPIIKETFENTLLKWLQ
jgi:PAS domain S-box-containing protein